MVPLWVAKQFQTYFKSFWCFTSSSFNLSFAISRRIIFDVELEIDSIWSELKRLASEDWMLFSRLCKLFSDADFNSPPPFCPISSDLNRFGLDAPESWLSLLPWVSLPSTRLSGRFRLFKLHMLSFRNSGCWNSKVLSWSIRALRFWSSTLLILANP